MISLDTKLFYAINGLAGHSKFWDIFFVWASKLSITIFCLVLAYFFFKNIKVFWLGVISSVLSRFGITEFIREIHHRSRPFEVLPDVNHLQGGELVIRLRVHEPAFPSGHAAFLFAVAFSVFLYNKKFGAILILVSFLFVFARIFIGVHYPLDVAGGIAVAVISVFITKKYILKQK